MPTPTTKHVNVKTVTFQPGGTGTAIALTGIKDATYDQGIMVIKDSADADLFMSVATAVGYDPGVTLTSNSSFQLLTVVGGTRGTLAFDVPDAYNGVTTGGGGYSVTMTNAIMEKWTQTHGHRKYSGLSLGFTSMAPDGITHPVTITAL